MSVSVQAKHDQAAEEERFAAHTQRLQEHHRARLADMENEQSREVEELRKFHERQLEDLRKNYEVEISLKAKGLEERLKQQETDFSKKFSEREKQIDQAFEKLAAREKARADAFRKNQDERISKLHEQYQLAQEQMNASHSGNG